MRLITKQNIMATAVPFTIPKIPPKVLLIVPITLNVNILFMNLAIILTTNNNTITRITDNKIDIYFVTIGFTNESEIF